MGGVTHCHGYSLNEQGNVPLLLDIVAHLYELLFLVVLVLSHILKHSVDRDVIQRHVLGLTEEPLFEHYDKFIRTNVLVAVDEMVRF